MTLNIIIILTLSVSCWGQNVPPLTSVENEEVGAPKSELKSQKLDLPVDVQFSAFRHARFQRSKELHKPVKFEGVEYNVGGYFDPQTGYFTAPSFGLYVFNYTSYKSISRRVRLMKNNYEVQVLSDDGKGKAKNLKGGRRILLQLDEKDRVWLRLAHGKKETTQTNSTSTLTAFAGRLLATESNSDRYSHPSSSTRYRRSSGHGFTQERLSLQRLIRDINSPPVALVEKRLDEFGFPGERDAGEILTPTADTTANQKIAFSVTCTKSMIGGHMADTRVSLNGEMSEEATPNGRLAFDKILVNVGGSFDIDAGEFLAPTDGAYFFSYNVGKFPRKKLSVMLMKNVNEVQSIIYNDSKTRAREIQGQSLMLMLKKGDVVWLRSYNNDEFAVYSNLGNYITFSGYLVYSL